MVLGISSSVVTILNVEIYKQTNKNNKNSLFERNDKALKPKMTHVREHALCSSLFVLWIDAVEVIHTVR